LSVGRTRYNEVAREYNVMVKSFPTNLFAGMFGYRERPYYQLTNEGARNVPRVQFPSAPSSVPDTAGAH
jgi:LemA protein